MKLKHTQRERPYFESSQLSVDESDKVNELLGVLFNYAQKAAGAYAF